MNDIDREVLVEYAERALAELLKFRIEETELCIYDADGVLMERRVTKRTIPPSITAIRFTLENLNKPIFGKQAYQSSLFIDTLIENE